MGNEMKLLLWGAVATLCVGSHAWSADNKLPPARSDQAFSSGFWTTRIETAKIKIKPGIINEISDYFSVRDRIYAHATLIAKGPVVPFGATFTFRWFNRDVLIFEASGTHKVLDTPMYVVHGLEVKELGPGNCRVELYADDRLLAKRSFSVAER